MMHSSTVYNSPKRSLRSFWAALLVMVGLALICSAAQAEQYIWLRNYWKADHYINIEKGAPAAGRIKPGWHSAQWVVEGVPGTNYRRLRNRWQPEHYLHIENGKLQAGPILPGWHSAQWTILTPSGVKGLYRIGNRWKSEQYLHIENGSLQAGPILEGWHSAMWYYDRQPPQ